MDINVNVDTSILDKHMKGYEKNLAYSTAQALNDSAKAIQGKMRDQLRVKFKIRKNDFMMRRIKIMEWASVAKDKPYAVVGVDMKSRLLLPMFEEGGAKRAFIGKHVGVPITGQAARQSFEQPVSKEFTFKGLGFKRKTRHDIGVEAWTNRPHSSKPKKRKPGKHASDSLWVGRERTFILGSTKRAPQGGVFQRVGTGKDDIRMVYTFKSTVPIRQGLDFTKTAREVYDNTFREAFYRRFLHLNRATKAE